MSSDEVYSSSVVGSAVDERGVEVFDHVIGSVTKQHLGVLWGIVDPVFNAEFGDLFVNFILDVGVWDSLVCCQLCQLKFDYFLFICAPPLKLRICFFSVCQSSYFRALWSMIQGNQIQNYLYRFYRFYRDKIKMIIGLSR